MQIRNQKLQQELQAANQVRVALVTSVRAEPSQKEALMGQK